mgnify:CR=1 FL=1
MKDEKIIDKDNTPIKAEDLELVSGGRYNPGKPTAAFSDEIALDDLEGVSGGRYNPGGEDAAEEKQENIQ